jgi:hypothetical protein
MSSQDAPPRVDTPETPEQMGFERRLDEAWRYAPEGYVVVPREQWELRGSAP